MAKDSKTVTLNLDIKANMDSLKNIQKTLTTIGKEGFSTKTIQKQFESLQTQVEGIVKDINKDFNQLSVGKFSSTSEVKQAADRIKKGYGSIGSAVGRAKGQLTNIYSSKENQDSLAEIRQLSKALEELEKDYEAVKNISSKVKMLGTKSSLTSRSSEIQKQLKSYDKKSKDSSLSQSELINQSKLKQELDEINKKLQTRLDLLAQIAAIEGKYGVTTVEGVKSKINENISQQNDYNAVSVSQYKEMTKKYDSLLQMSQLGGDNFNAEKPVDQFNQLTLAMAEAEARSKTFKSVLTELGIPLMSLHGIVSSFKDVLNYSYDYIKNLDSALTEISVVSGKSRESVQALTDTFIELSAQTGMAIDQIAEASTIYYQQGLGDEAVEELTEYTALFAKISGETVSVAADQITAAMNGFGYAYSEVEDIVDKMSVLAAHSAADIDELATAMSKGASQAAMAGLTFDEYNAYLATMIEVTREAPENLGTSLKTIMSRFLSIKTGDNTDDDTDVNKVETALKTVGVQLRDSEGELRELGDVLNDLGPKWNSLDRNTQAYLGTIIAGTRQQSRFISLMQNWDRALELVEDSEDSAGAATTMHKDAMEGLDASINNLTNAWQKLISNVVDSDFFKTVIDGLTGVVQYFANGNSILKIITSAILLFNAKTLITNYNLTKQGETIKNVNTIWGSFKGALENVKIALGDLSSPMTVTTKNIVDQTEKLKAHTEALNNDAAAQASHDGKKTKTSVTTPSEPVTEQNNNGTGNSSKSTQLSIKSLFSKDGLKGLGQKFKTLGTNSSLLMGKFQTLAGAFSVGYTTFQGINSFIDNILPYGDSLVNQAQETFNSYQEEKEAQADIITTLNENLDTYEELSKKVNKTTDEIEEMGQAANAIADVIPSLTNGYDINGNPVINVRSAKDTQEEAELELAEQSMAQMESIGETAVGELQAAAQEKVEDVTSTISTVSTTAGTVAGYAIGAKIGASIGSAAGSIVPGIGTAVGAAVGTVLGGLLGKGINAIITNAAYEDSIEELSDVFSEERINEMYENIANINQAIISDKTIDGVSSNERSSLISYLSQSYMDDVMNKAAELILNGDSDAGIDLIENSAYKYNALFGTGENQISERELATLYKQIQTLSIDAAETSFESIEEKIGSLLEKTGISSDNENYDSLKEGIGNAIYSNTGSDYYTQMKNIQEELIKFGTQYQKKVGEETTEKIVGYVREENESEEETNEFEEKISDNLDVIAGGYKTNSSLNGSYVPVYATSTTPIYETNSKASDVFKTLTSEQSEFLYNNGLFNNGEVLSAILENNNSWLMDALEVSETNGQLALISLLEKYNKTWDEKMAQQASDWGYDDWTDIDYETLSDEDKAIFDSLTEGAEAYQEALEEVYSTMELSSSMTWTQLAEGIEEATSKLQIMDGILEDIKDDNAVDWENFQNLASVLDGIDYSSLSIEQLEKYNTILDNLSSGWNVVNGQITLNEKGVKSLADMQAYLAELELEEMKTQLETKKAELEVNQSVLEAEKASIEYKLETLGVDVDATKTSAEEKLEAENAWVSAATTTTSYFSDAQADAASSILRSYTSAFQGIAEEWNKVITALNNGETISASQITDKYNEFNDKISDTFNLEGYLKKIEENSGIGDLSIDDQISYYKSQLEAINDELASNKTSINNINAQLRVLDNSASSLSGVVSEASADADDDAEEYIGELKEIYNILRRIEMLEHRLSTLDTYSEMVAGSDYGDLLQSRLNYASQLVDQYQFLTTEQKKFENGYREFINSLEVIEGVFDFDEAGQIIINWEKYISLSEEATEIADEVYETYQDMHDDTMEYYDSLLEAKQTELDYNQEIVDSWIDMEEEMADAIKEIYQDILDAKLDAIDQEKEAIEDLRAAREEAEEDQQNAKTVSGLQTNLQRALMDTSGASDSALIKAQQDLDDTLADIAEDKYSEMLDNIIDSLDEEKEALQDQFDELFENLDWLYSMIDDRLYAGDTNSIYGILKQTDEWNQQSDAARNMTVDTWDQKMSTLISTFSNGGESNTIEGIIEQTKLAKSEIQAFEEALKTTETKDGQEIVSSLSNIASIASKNAGSGSTYQGNGNKFPSGDDGDPSDDPDPVKKEETPVHPEYQGKLGGMVGQTIELDREASDYTYDAYTDLSGSEHTGFTDISPADTNLKIITGPTWSEQLQKYLIKVKALSGSMKGKEFWMPASADTNAVGSDLYFHDRGWLKSGTKYATGGFADYTGPAWLDGTKEHPEAVLNALQTEHFITFTNALDKIVSGASTANTSNASVSIDTISFNVDSMSSAEDGETAFNAFVNKFKEIGSQSGLTINSYKNKI